MSQSNIAVVQAMYAAFGRGDLPGLISNLAPEAEWRVIGQKDYPTMGTWKGPAAVTDFFRLVGETEQFSEFKPETFDAAGDRVFVMGRYTFKVLKTGQTVSSDWVHVFTLRSGKVVSFCEFNDSATIVAAYRN